MALIPSKALVGSAAAFLVVLTFAAAPANAFTISFDDAFPGLVTCNPDRCSGRHVVDPIPDLRDIHGGKPAIFSLPDRVPAPEGENSFIVRESSSKTAVV